MRMRVVIPMCSEQRIPSVKEVSNPRKERIMNTRKTGALALSAVAVLVAVSGCAGLRAQNTEGSAGGLLSQQDFQEMSRSESAQLRLEARSGAAARADAHSEAIRLDKQAGSVSATPAGVEAVQLAKQAESRAGVSSVSTPSSAEAVRTVKQAESRQGPTSLQQHQLEHGASHERLR